MGNNIIDGKATGVYVYDEGRVEIKEGNKIERNAFHGVAVRDGGASQVVREKKYTHTHAHTHTHTQMPIYLCLSVSVCVCVPGCPCAE